MLCPQLLLQVVEDQDKLLKQQQELKKEHGLNIMRASLYDTVLEVILYTKIRSHKIALLNAHNKPVAWGSIYALSFQCMYNYI